MSPTHTPRDLLVPDVLAAAGKGEDWALAELFRAYQGPLVRYLRAQEPRLADDLAGEVWIAVARGLQRFSGDEAGFRSWLFTIARRRLIEHRRRAARRRTEPIPPEDFETDAHLPAEDPARVVISQMESQAAVDTLIADLPPDQAEAVLLRVVGGFDVPEVATLMGRTPGAVRVLCHRALRRLATRFVREVRAE